MRRYWEEQRPASTFNGPLIVRLAAAVGMLLLIYMLIVRMGNPDMWRWFAGGGAEPSRQDQSAGTPTPIPEATGPTHEDPEQAEKAEEDFQALTDGELNLKKVEMVPYCRLVNWVKNQSFERLRRLARDDLLYTHFYDEPDKYRGRLATMKLDVRQAIDAGKACDDVQLYEVIGVTEQSAGRPYYLIVVDYPKDMPVGTSLDERVRFAGYFLKLQGYQSALSKPGDPILKAPLLIGRIEWIRPVAAKGKDSQEWGLGLTALVAIGLVILVGYVLARLKPKRTAPLPTTATTADGEVVSIESWLENADLNPDDKSVNDANDDADRQSQYLDE